MITPNHKHEFKYEVLARHIFYQIEDLDTRSNLFKKNFLFSNHQKWQWIRHNEEKIVGCERNQQLHQIKKGVT